MLRAHRGAGRRAALLLVVALVVAACSNGDDSPAEQVAPPPSGGRPGELVEASARTGDDVPDGAGAFDVTYRSTGVTNEPVDVTGVVYVPEGSAPEEGRPVLTWAHGTTGVADDCAPSETGVRVPYLDRFLDAGYVVAATDYQGMGTPGAHPYLVGTSEAHGVLDAARAAREVEGSRAGEEVVVVGHSQGGHAALFAGQLSSYAPELDLAGVVALAPAAQLETLLDRASRFSLGFGIAATAAYAYAEAYPELELGDVLTPAGVEQAGVVDERCIDEVLDAFADEATDEWLEADPVDLADWAGRIEENTPGAAPIQAPVLVAQGDRDIVVPDDSTEEAVRRACTAGSGVEYRTYDGADHSGVLGAAEDDVVPWVADRLAGEPVGPGCG